MKLDLLDAKSVAARLRNLIGKHGRISLAMAWGDLTPVAEILLENSSKFGSVLFGVDFLATDPDLIDRLVDVPGAFVAKNRPGCFHPKIFYFASGPKAEAIVGSANFTKGGLGANLEASVHVKGAVDDPFFDQIRERLEQYRPLHMPVTKIFAASYRRQTEAAAAAARSRAKNPIMPTDVKGWARLNSALASMSWREFARLARQDVHHDFRKRVKLLRWVQQTFARTGSFADLPVAEWKAIAGVIGRVEAEEAGLAGFEWGWFGSMGGAGTFAELIGQRNAAIGVALDAIPPRGEVTQSDYRGYVRAFTAAFAGSSRTARLGPATRLLAMKRPDRFVCVNGGNQANLAKALAFAPTTISLDNYWERVVVPVQQAPWFTTARPVGGDRELWDARVAMLDAIYYEPRAE